MKQNLSGFSLLSADGLLSYSAPEGQLMMSPGNPAVISLNDSTYDGVHEKRSGSVNTSRSGSPVPSD